MASLYFICEGGDEMPRRARKYVRTPFFHVMCQGIKRENVFDTDENIEKYLVFVKKYQKEFFVDVVAYCVMSNHVHLLLHTYNIEMLSKFMHKLNGVYAMYYNDKKERVGYVFRDRFRLEEITNNKYLLTCILYIHNNPVKASICKSAGNYRYSSYKEFVTGKFKLVSENIVRQVIGENMYSQIEEDNCNEEVEHLDLKVEPEVKVHEVISNFEVKNNKKLSEILNNYNDRKELLIQLHVKNKISYRCIEKVLSIERRQIPNFLNDQGGQT